MPFGKHRGESLTAVPSSYLAWALRECKLSWGLHHAVSGELRRRGITPSPAAPAGTGCPVRCLRCGAEQLRHTWQEFADGRRQVRRDCGRCGGFIGFAPRRPPWTTEADRNASPTPVLDALVLADQEDVELVSDGQQVHIGRGWERASARLKDAVRQNGRLLASLLGKGGHI